MLEAEAEICISGPVQDHHQTHSSDLMSPSDRVQQTEQFAALDEDWHAVVGHF